MNQENKKTWLVAVSGGADSMALLDMCVKANVKVAVAHVNYQKRDSANRDMNGVKAYCQKYDIPFFVHLVQNYGKDNFQAQAREIRYAFFKQIVLRHHYEGVLVAHHLDDVLETYIMQKERGSIPAYYGIKEEAMLMGIRIKRPLLNMCKDELCAYCRKMHVVYYDDESNFSDAYTRNQIRHKQIMHMSIDEKHMMQKEIDYQNQIHYQKQKRIASMTDAFDETIPQAYIQSLCVEDACALIREFVYRQIKLVGISERNILEFVKMVRDKKGNFKHNINGAYDFCVEYGMLYIDCQNEESYAYIYDEVKEEVTPYFTIAKTGKCIEGVTLREEDYPIMIRNVKAGDKIQLRFGTKKVSRFFIDNKISHKQRRLWPIVVNREGKVIFVCGIGCDIEHYSNNSTMFVLK